MSARTPITAECAKLLAQIKRICPGVLPPAPLAAGMVAPAINVTADQALKLFPAAASTAAGIDPFSSAAPPSAVKWKEGDRELLIFPSKVTASFAAGVIAVSIPVSSDQSGDATVHVSLVVGDPNQPAGLIAATDARPTGPPLIIDAWSGALIAFAWHIVLEIVTNIAGGAGRDVDGAPLVPVALAASSNGLSIVPMARHPFDRARK